MLKSKAKKEAEGPEWELIATSAEDLTEVGEKLKRSKKPADQALADMVSYLEPPEWKGIRSENLLIKGGIGSDCSQLVVVDNTAWT